jgi:hypothetical protein
MCTLLPIQWYCRRNAVATLLHAMYVQGFSDSFPSIHVSTLPLVACLGIELRGMVGRSPCEGYTLLTPLSLYY